MTRPLAIGKFLNPLSATRLVMASRKYEGEERARFIHERLLALLGNRSWLEQAGDDLIVVAQLPWPTMYTARVYSARNGWLQVEEK